MNRPRILLIDDDPNILESGKDILEDAGYGVLTAKSLKEARAFLSAASFSLIIADQNLPDGTGLQLASELGSRMPHTPFILMTGEMDSHASPLGLAARQQGLVDDCLLKPVNIPQMLLIIKRYVS